MKDYRAYCKRIRNCNYNIFHFYFQHRRNLHLMTSGTSSQSQPSYLHTIEEKPNFQAITPQQILDQSSAASLMKQLAASMTVEQGQQFEICLNSLNILFEKGYSHLLITYPLLLRKLMNHFTRLGKQLEDDSQNSKIQIRMLHVLSLIAELLRNNPKYYYPFTRKFLITVFSIDAQLLHKSPIKKQILAILAVIYENLSRQYKLVTKYAIESNLKQAILGNYYLIEQILTLKVMNKTITNLTSKGIHISVAQFSKYKVMETVSNIIAKSQLQLFMVKMKMTMLSLNSKKSPVHLLERNQNQMAEQKQN